MDNIVNLMPKEHVQLDREQLRQLMIQVGPSEADRTINQALENLAICLADVQKAQKRSQPEGIARGAVALIGIARQLGMTTLARIARDVRDLSHSNDTVAFNAATTRLGRIGECSLIAVWDLQDLSI